MGGVAMMARLWQLLTRLETFIWIWLFILASITIGGIGTLVKGLNYDLLVIVTIGGVLLGRIMARIRAPWWLGLLLITASGLQMVIMLVGYLWSLLLNLAAVVIVYLVILWWGGFNGLPSLDPLQAAMLDVVNGTGVVFTRLGNWLLASNKTGTLDPLPVQLVWGWALWVAAAWAAYMIWQNRQALLAVIPLGALLTVTTFFTGVDNSIVSIFLGIALVLQTGSSWKRRQQRWESTQTDWATDIAIDVSSSAFMLIMLIFTMSLMLPQISLSELINKLQFQQKLAQSGQRIDNMAASLGIERQVPLPTQTPHSVIPGGLPRRHLLGAGPELTEEVVMLVKTNDPPPPPPEVSSAPPPPAYYWIGATYDTYNGYGWVSGPTTPTDLEPDQLQLEPPGPGRIITQTVQPINPSSNVLFTIGLPIRVNQPSQITFRTHQDWAGTILQPTEVYTAQSWLSKPTVEELRQAGTDYPDWLTQRYLALPQKVPDRVRALALELTATAATPYDRALAIETYLRQIPYSLDLPYPPANRDVVEYFLFDLKKGYCDYYASSMVVLARAAGIPARFVIGYAPSPYDYNTYQYIIREAEAHSWAQVYFPGYGWIDFEPTAGRSPINRSGQSSAALPTLPPDFNLDRALASPQGWWYNLPLWQLLAIGLGSVGSITLLGLLLVSVNDWGLARLPAERLIPLLEGRLETNAQWLDTPLVKGVTPLEFETALRHRLADLGQKQPSLQKILPRPTNIEQVINTFVRLRYAPHRVAATDSRTCLTAWQRLRWRLWGTILVKKVRRLK